MPRVEHSPERDRALSNNETYRRSKYDEPIREMNRWFPFFLGSTSSLVLTSIALALVLPHDSDSRFNQVTMLPATSTTVTPPPVVPPPPQPLSANVSVEESTITGIIDSKTLTSSLYWTMKLRGEIYGKQEADMTMLLPEGAAVTRATLWVNGVPQEAAFNTTARVQSAYNAVVSRMRDPLLITCQKPGEVKIKAFPIEQHQDLQLRIGITSPVKLTRAGSLSLGMPYISSSNMNFSHSQNVHLESDALLSTNNDGIASSLEDGMVNLRGNIAVERLKELKLSGQRANFATKFATRATHSFPRGFIVANLDPSSGELDLFKTIEQPVCQMVTADDAAHRLSKVWAIGEITRLLANGDASLASDLGITYRVVSPVTGATVLETNNDYKQFGLHRDLYKSLSYNGHKARRRAQHADKEYRRDPGSDDVLAEAARSVPAPKAAPQSSFAENKAQGGAQSFERFPQAEDSPESMSTRSPMPVLAGATNGTIAPQGADATVVMGVNTAGTVRAQNLANLERLTESFAKVFQIL